MCLLRVFVCALSCWTRRVCLFGLTFSARVLCVECIVCVFLLSPTSYTVGCRIDKKRRKKKTSLCTQLRFKQACTMQSFTLAFMAAQSTEQRTGPDRVRCKQYTRLFLNPLGRSVQCILIRKYAYTYICIHMVSTFCIFVVLMLVVVVVVVVMVVNALVLCCVSVTVVVCLYDW